MPQPPAARIPDAWFNVAGHLPAPRPPLLHPGTGGPVGPDDLAPLFPMALVGQEVTTDPWVDVPGEVLDVLGAWRPTPLVRARRLEQALGTPARIYYKDESVSPAGSHHPNTAVAQAFYNRREGVTRLATATATGGWGSALAFACAPFGLDCRVYMARSWCRQRTDRQVMIEAWGGAVEPSPVDNASHPGSTGTAIADAVRDAAERPDTHYALGSVRSHVLLHQTVVGLEAKEQLAAAGEGAPDVVIAGSHGGSGIGGIALPFVPDAGVRLMAVESSSSPTLTSGRFDHDAVPPAVRAAGLGSLGDAPVVSSLVSAGRMEAVAYPRAQVFEAAVRFARAQGPIPAIGTAHAVRAAIDEALLAREDGSERVILFSFSRPGAVDLAAYDAYLHAAMGG